MTAIEEMRKALSSHPENGDAAFVVRSSLCRRVLAEIDAMKAPPAETHTHYHYHFQYPIMPTGLFLGSAQQIPVE